MKQVYICTDTITGLYSAIHDAWKECRDKDAGIEIRGRTQQQLFCEYRTVAECESKAERLERMIKRYLGYNAYWDIYHALLSPEADKGTAVFKTIQEARNIRDSRKIMDHLGNPDVAKVFAMSRSVSNEAHMYEEFIRFRELENGILFSEITPKAQVLTCVADHFTDRFPLENWMIYDKSHGVFLVHRARESWGLVWGETLDEAQAGKVSEKEKEYERLWSGFFQSISIQERENPGCQRNHLPLRYRDQMPEFRGRSREPHRDQRNTRAGDEVPGTGT